MAAHLRMGLFDYRDPLPFSLTSFAGEFYSIETGAVHALSAFCTLRLFFRPTDLLRPA